MSTIRIWSPLPPAEFVARLGTAIDPELWGGSLGMSRATGKPFVGSIDGVRVSLRKRSSFGITPLLQPRLIAKFESAGVGTYLGGKFGATPFLWVFMAVLPVGVTLSLFFFGLMAVAGAPLGPAKDYAIAFWLPLLMVLPLLIAIGGLVAYVRHRTREEQPLLTEFLVRTLDAEQAPGG